MKLEFHEAPMPNLSWKWYCIDGDTYDGADDAHPIDSVIGYGVTKQEAAEDWLEQTLDLSGFDWQETESFKYEWVCEMKKQRDAA